MKKQLSLNLITNITYVIISVLIGIWLTPFALKKLGDSAYGYVAIINNLIGFMIVITYTLNSMVGRFFTVSEKKGDHQAASEYISTAAFTNLSISLLLLPVLLITTLYLNKIINIQKIYVTDVKIAFFFAGISFLVSTLSSVMATATYCCNRLEISNVVNIFGSIMQITTLIILFNMVLPHIWFISLASLVCSSVMLILGAITFRILMPQIKFKISLFKLKKCKDLLFSGAWNSLIIMGNTLMVQIDLLVGNALLASALVGQYAAVLLIPSVLRLLASSISSAFSPTTVALYAQGDMEKLKSYTNSVIKFVSFMLGWPISVICGLGGCLLVVWLGADFRQFRFILILLTLPLTVNMAVSQLNVLQQALNKVRTPAIVTSIMGVANVGLAFLLAGYFKMGLYGIAISDVVILSLKNVVFLPVYSALITKQSTSAYYKGIASPFIVATFVGAIGFAIDELLKLNSFIELLAFGAVLSVIYFSASYIAISKSERIMVLDFIKPVLKRFGLMRDKNKSI